MNRFIIILFFEFLLFTTLHSTDRFTARDVFPKADSIAFEHLSTPLLTDIKSTHVDSTGKSDYWIFQHDSLTIYISHDSMHAEPSDYYNYIGWAPLKDGWINSDKAVSIAESNGGKEFRKNNPNAKISAQLYGDTSVSFPVWRIVYSSEDSVKKRIRISLNALDGSIFWQRTTGLHEEKVNNQKNFCLQQNYPNPFNATTTIAFHLPKSDFVTLKIYNLSSQLVETLANEHMPAGRYKIKWHANQYPSGIYFYKLHTLKYEYESLKKLILQK